VLYSQDTSSYLDFLKSAQAVNILLNSQDFQGYTEEIFSTIRPDSYSDKILGYYDFF